MLAEAVPGPWAAIAPRGAGGEHQGRTHPGTALRSGIEFGTEVAPFPDTGLRRLLREAGLVFFSDLLAVRATP